jgi:hypothetical protein
MSRASHPRASLARIITSAAAGAAAAAALALVPASALAVPTGLCINTAGAPHILFGPNSFFEPSDVQGPTSFQENTAQTVATYPLYRGSSGGQEVDYVITDASSLPVARALGVNYSPKLNASAGTAAVQQSSSSISSGNGIDFPATVDFSAPRTLQPDPVTGFPPQQALPGAVGNPGYSPLVEVRFNNKPVILTAPQLANATGQHPKLSAPISPTSSTAHLSETFGCFDDLSVHYVSFDASSPVAAAIENVTYAPALDSSPAAGCADHGSPSPQHCGRESLAAFTNGPTPLSNNQWQGLNNSLLTLCGTHDAGGQCENNGFQISPFNILRGVPNPTQMFAYSPLWDIHFASWTQAAIANGVPIRVGNFQDVIQEAAMGYVAGFPNTSPFGPSGFIVTCPPVSLDVPAGDIPTGT